MAAEISLAALAGGLAALIVVALIDPTGEFRHIDAAAITVGLLSGIGLDRLLRG